MSSIIVGVDGSAGGAKALQWAVQEGQLHGWKVTAVMAWGLFDQPSRETFDPDYGEADALAALDEFVEKAIGPQESAAVERRAVCDLPAQALIQAATGASLLVVGARGLGGFRGLLLGSVSQHCLRHALCPVGVVREDESGGGPGGRIVVGIDGSEPARLALRWALDEARARQASVDVVHSWQMPSAGAFTPLGLEPAVFEDAARAALDGVVDAEDTSGLTTPVNRRVVQGGAASSILEAATGADLVVVASRGHGGFAGLLLGSVSLHVAHHAACPVVVVPHGR